jgi:hypothetical protein
VIGPWLKELVLVVVVVVVSVLDVVEVDTGVEVEVVVKVLEVVQVAIASSPSPPPEQPPLPADTGMAALDVLSPIATEVTKKTNTNPTKTKVAFLVLSLLVVVEDPVNIVLKYRSQIYIIIPNDHENSLTPK